MGGGGLEVHAVAVVQARTVRKILDCHRNPLGDGDPQRRRILALDPRGGHLPDGRDPVGHRIGVDLQQRPRRPGPRAACNTCSSVTDPVPTTTTLRTDISGVKYMTRPRPTVTTSASSPSSTTLRPRTEPRAGRGAAARVAGPSRLASRRASSMAWRGLRPRRSARSRRSRCRGPSNSASAASSSATASGSASASAEPPAGPSCGIGGGTLSGSADSDPAATAARSFSAAARTCRLAAA